MTPIFHGASKTAMTTIFHGTVLYLRVLPPLAPTNVADVVAFPSLLLVS